MCEGRCGAGGFALIELHGRSAGRHDANNSHAASCGRPTARGAAPSASSTSLAPARLVPFAISATIWNTTRANESRVAVATSRAKTRLGISAMFRWSLLLCVVSSFENLAVADRLDEQRACRAWLCASRSRSASLVRLGVSCAGVGGGGGRERPLGGEGSTCMGATTSSPRFVLRGGSRCWSGSRR